MDEKYRCFYYNICPFALRIDNRRHSMRGNILLISLAIAWTLTHYIEIEKFQLCVLLLCVLKVLLEGTLCQNFGLGHSVLYF